ncbi:DUF6754 domain-containing protein [Calditrichota bacterium]
MFSRIPALVTSLILFLSMTVTAEEVVPPTDVSLTLMGASVPGVYTDIELTWIRTGRIMEPATYRLYRIGLTPEPQLVTELPIDATRYKDSTPYKPEGINYRLDLMQADSVIYSTEALALVAAQGGYASFTAEDRPGDAGGAVDVKWQYSDKAENVTAVQIYRTPASGGVWELVSSVPGSDSKFTDEDLDHEAGFNYMIRGIAENAIWESAPALNVRTEVSWFDMRKINLFIIALIVIGAVSYYVLQSTKKEMFIRKIAGLEAVEEAVGRATEMGRSVLYVPGIQDMDDVQTIAGLTILGSVAKMTAKYETKLDVPVSRSLVMSNGREVVKESYLSVGRPDFYHDDIVHYVTDEQFGYVAAVDGIMVREKPAACFYLGAFFAESLILAETGNHVGAIQIAGTAMPTQLPFFVAACDYTLIGEELFAASAYLSGDKRMIASLRGQDVGKLMAMGSILFGSVIATLAGFSGGEGFFASFADAFGRLFALNF